MSKPKIPPTAYGYSLWKQHSSKDVHVQYFSYNFKEINEKHVKDQEESKTDRDREVEKQVLWASCSITITEASSHRFVYDTHKRELSATYSGCVQTCVVDALVDMMQESIKDISAIDDRPHYHTNAVSYLFQSPADEKERYRLVGDVLITTGSGPVFAIETATRHSYPSIKDKVKKWFLLPSISGVLLIHVNEGNGYWKPTFRPQDGEILLINSWAWLNFIVDINEEKIDLFDCSKPVTYDEHVWVGSMTCALELYERDLSSKSACAMTKRYEFIVPDRELNLEATEELRGFETRFSEIWEEAVDGTSLEGFRRFAFNWRRLAQVVAKTRLQLAYARYRTWFTKYEKSTTSTLGKRRRDDTVDASSQEACFPYLKRRSFPFTANLTSRYF
ncbi:hypothetical protein A7U60_g6132 [Sanghuangporus baumii]|uniref:Uncharacterized protein n=1 Tax=Sanghuangporus baumii TaxID=108892 RepID=A0A9Q5NAQ8_SANBA|nr:hypothetical protein A7U60_g6132 [Sanghuangporus baumii]